MPPSLLTIRLYGDPALRKKSLPVKDITDEKRNLIESMIATMHQSKGIGLAAPQVGINERIIVVDVGECPFALINPRVLDQEGSWVLEEGCLSLPGVTLNIKRPQKISVTYLDQNNQKMKKDCVDLLARVILHEIDHLDGRLIIDYATLREKWKLRKKLNEIRKGSVNEKNNSTYKTKRLS
jgi:peptide deformylase